ncbi:MAG: LysR substrate-binding domain-containing protein, partial [Paraburkholderia sp.]
STTPASYLLPYLIAGFHRRYPEVALHTVDGNTAEIVGALASLDIAMVEGPVGADLPPDTAVHPWREDEIVAIMPRSHPLAQGLATGCEVASGVATSGVATPGVAAPAARIELEALGAHPLVLREAGSGVRQMVERAFARAGVPMRVALEIAGVEGVKEAVRAGMGIGFVSAMSMRHEGGALCLFSLSPEPLTRRFSILIPHASAPSRVVERFLALTAESAD